MAKFMLNGEKVDAVPMEAPVYLNAAGAVVHQDREVTQSKDGEAVRTRPIEPKGGPGYWLVRKGGAHVVVADAEFRAGVTGVSRGPVSALAAQHLQPPEAPQAPAPTPEEAPASDAAAPAPSEP